MLEQIVSVICIAGYVVTTAAATWALILVCRLLRKDV